MLTYRNLYYLFVLSVVIYLFLACKSVLLATSVACSDSSGEIVFIGEDCFFTVDGAITCEMPTNKIYHPTSDSVCMVIR